MDITKLQTKKIYEQVAEQLRRKIEAGELKPKERLESVEQLSKRFQVGRSTIREALSALRAMGLVEIRQGEGTFVSSMELPKLAEPIGTYMKLNRAELQEFFEVRRIIETGAVGLAAAKRTPEQLAHMEAALRDMEAAVDDGQLGEQADARFHIAIAEAAGNRMLLTMMNQISETLQAAMRESRRLMLFSDAAMLTQLHREHSLIYEAILEQDGGQAAQLMEEHLNKVESLLYRTLQSDGVTE